MAKRGYSSSRMTEELDTVRRELEQQSTESLVSILRNRDEDEWRPEVFDIVARILHERGVSPDDVTALGPEAIDVVESEATVTLATFFSPAHAHACRGALENAGLKAWVVDEALGTIYAMGVGTRVQVRQQDIEAAQAILDKLEDSPPSADALPPELAEPPCPRCGSVRVIPFAEMDDELVRLGPLGFGRRWKYRCGDCDCIWSSSD